MSLSSYLSLSFSPFVLLTLSFISTYYSLTLPPPPTHTLHLVSFSPSLYFELKPNSTQVIVPFFISCLGRLNCLICFGQNNNNNNPDERKLLKKEKKWKSIFKLSRPYFLKVAFKNDPCSTGYG